MLVHCDVKPGGLDSRKDTLCRAGCSSRKGGIQDGVVVNVESLLSSMITAAGRRRDKRDAVDLQQVYS